MTMIKDDYDQEHLDGIPWYDAPKPRWWHLCWAQTVGWVHYFDRVERCACGSMRVTFWDSRWPTRFKNRNSR